MKMDFFIVFFFLILLSPLGCTATLYVECQEIYPDEYLVSVHKCRNRLFFVIPVKTGIQENNERIPRYQAWGILVTPEMTIMDLSCRR